MCAMPAALDDPALQTVGMTLNALATGAVLVDQELRIVFANNWVRDVFGGNDELLGRSVLDWAVDERGRTLLTQYAAQRTGVAQVRAVLRPEDGEMVPTTLTVAPFPGVAGGAYLLVTVADLRPLQEEAELFEERYRDIAQLSDTVLEQALELKRYTGFLERRVEQRTVQLSVARTESIMMLAMACESRDNDTGEHVRRIQHYTERLAELAGLSPDEAHQMGHAAMLHDVGKIQIPDTILNKPGPLTAAERRIMQQHTIAGEQLLGDAPSFGVARVIARSHHEDWDGSGYPDGLKGDSIPLAARIVHLVDVFDALTAKRAYKDAWPLNRTIETLRMEAGRSFDPDLVEAFLSGIDIGEFG